jgi:predicted acetyltransferase
MNQMSVTLDSVGSGEEAVVNRLMQLYAYDFSEFMGWDIADDAVFFSGETRATYVPEPWRHAFFLRVEGHLAGFVIVDEKSRITGDPDVVDMSQFFVLRKYRRSGVGAFAAAQAFDRFPRKWEVRELAKNEGAIAFWRKTIARYTAGRYIETLFDDDRWRGPVQSFDARTR